MMTVDLHQRLDLIARLRLISPELSRECTNDALNDMIYDAKFNKLVWLYHMPRRTLTAIAELRPAARIDLLSTLLDDMGVPE